jgi:hypothetical protein
MDSDTTLNITKALWEFVGLFGKHGEYDSIYNKLYHKAWLECPQPLGYQGFLTERYDNDTAE